MKKILYGSLLAIATLSLVACQQNETDSSAPSSLTSDQSATSTETSRSASSAKAAPSRRLVNDRYDAAYAYKKLYGVITAPENYKELRLPTIVISHGFNNTLEQYEEMATNLASQGYVVYRFDFYGGSRNSKSGGQDMLDMSVTTEQEDLTQVVDHLSQETFVDQDRISLLGASQGGVVSTLYAAAHPERVEKLMLIFPAFVLFDDVKETVAGYGVGDLAALPDVITHRNARLGRRYLVDAMEIDITSEMKKVTAPTLIIQGTDDDVVPYRYTVAASETMPNSQLVTVEGGGHWISADFMAVARPAMEAFLKR